jgi:AraC-like DNA-binding protein
MAKNYRDRFAEQRAMNDLHPAVREKTIAMLQNFEVIDGRAWDKETGEEITHLLDIGPKVKQQTYEQKEGARIREELAAHEKEHGGFIYAFFTACTQMSDRLSFLQQGDLARLMFIGSYVSWETNHLVYDNGRPINKRQLGELLGMSRSKYSEFYKKLTENEVIAETNEGLVMNPELFYRGRTAKIKTIVKTYEYTRLFRKTVRDLYATYNGRSIKKLALIYAVLPYVNFNHNIVSENPNEVKDEKIIPMTVTTLARRLGYSDTAKFTAALNSVTYKGQRVFGLFEMGDKRKRKVVVNPAAFYAGNGKHLAYIKLLFK